MIGKGAAAALGSTVAATEISAVVRPAADAAPRGPEDAELIWKNSLFDFRPARDGVYPYGRTTNAFFPDCAPPHGPFTASPARLSRKSRLPDDGRVAEGILHENATTIPPCGDALISFS